MPLSELKFALHEKEPYYKGDESFVGLAIANKVLHMVIGPSKIGKTRTTDRLVEMFPDTAVAITLTDRERKMDDPHAYRTANEGVTFEALHKLIMADQVVNYAISPSGVTYATTVESNTTIDSFPKLHNYLPTLSSSVTQLENADFLRTTKTYVTANANVWEDRINEADFKGSRRGRMEEAVVSLTYAQDHMEELKFIKSHQGENRLDETVLELMGVTLAGLPGRDKNRAEEELAEMLAIAKSLAVQSE